jgi:molybdopterin-guanine dinucleotide biosynthesis protein A
MGQPKAQLPFGGESMLARVVRLVSSAAHPVVVVSARDQPLPGDLPTAALRVSDERPQRGPLEGLAAGLRALAGRAEAAFACGCDAPLLRPALVARLVELLEDHDAVVPWIEGRFHPLAAVYRLSVLRQVEALLAGNCLALHALFERVNTRRVTAAELGAADPQLDSLRNVNGPEDYLAALAAAGLEPPEDFNRRLPRR